MLFRLLLLFTVVPLVELLLLIEIGEQIGLGATILLIVTTGVIGASLAKHEGLRTLRDIQSEFNAGRLPGDHLVDALLILVAGAVLITPGVITDAVGFTLLIPPARRFIRKQLQRRFSGSITMVDMSRMQRPYGSGDDFIDVEARLVDAEEGETERGEKGEK